MIQAFLLIGQSNMAGRGELGEMTPVRNEQVRMFRDGVWQTAVEPVHQDKPFAGESMATTFGDRLQRQLGKEIGLIPCAMGGTSLQEWQKEGALFANAVACAQLAMEKGAELKGILWHQGEGDSARADDASTYALRFLCTMDDLCKALSIPAVPIVVGEIGTFLYNRPVNPRAREVNAQLRSLPEKRANIACVSSQGLQHKGDCLHFDTASLREMGARYADAWLALAVKG